MTQPVLHGMAQKGNRPRVLGQEYYIVQDWEFIYISFTLIPYLCQFKDFKRKVRSISNPQFFSICIIQEIIVILLNSPSPSPQIQGDIL